MSTKKGKRIKGKHSGYKRITCSIYQVNNGKASEDRKALLKKRFLKRTTEALIMAAQE